MLGEDTGDAAGQTGHALTLVDAANAKFTHSIKLLASDYPNN